MFKINKSQAKSHRSEREKFPSKLMRVVLQQVQKQESNNNIALFIKWKRMVFPWEKHAYRLSAGKSYFTKEWMNHTAVFNVLLFYMNYNRIIDWSNRIEHKDFWFGRARYIIAKFLPLVQ